MLWAEWYLSDGNILFGARNRVLNYIRIHTEMETHSHGTGVLDFKFKWLWQMCLIISMRPNEWNKLFAQLLFK